MRKNNKGFVVTEVLILSTIIIGVLIFMYSQFKNINRSYQHSFKYDTVEAMYLTNNIVNYINDGNFDKLVENLNNSQEGYIDITECNIENSNLITFCSALYEKSGVEKIIFTEEDLTKIKTNMENFDNDLKEYIDQIKTNGIQNDYRIIVKYDNGTFASMRFNKGNIYVQNGLIAYLDGINNTGNGHSIDTTIWKDLSNNGNDATLYNSPTWSNNSITFDGYTNYGVLNNTINQEYTNGITYEIRLKVLSFIGLKSNGRISMIGNWDTAGYGLYYTSENKYGTNIYYNEMYNFFEMENGTNIGDLITFTVTYDNNTIRIYANGEKIIESSNDNNYVIKTSSMPITLAKHPSNENYANIEIQNMLIYDRALTENEVMRNYQADLARY